MKMPVRSSICTYSPSSASSNSKYSSPVSSLGSIGHYRPLSSSSLNVNSKSTSSYSSSSRSPAINNDLNTSSRRQPTTYSRYSSSSIYSPTTSNLNTSYSSLSSNSSVASSTYRPLSSTHSSFIGTSSSRYNANSLSTPTTGYSTGHSRYSSTGSTGSASSLSSASSSLLAGATGTATDGYYSTNTSNYNYPSSISGRRLSYTTQQSGRGADLPAGVPRGLVNLGNTCYMNASIQSLYSIDSFRNLIAGKCSSYNQALTSELSNLFKQMLQSSSPVSPANFKCAFSRHQSKFSGLGQQDAQEFLRYLINGVHEEFNQAAKRPRRSAPPRPPRTADEAWSQYRDIVDDSPLVDLVVGQMCSTICCSVCQNKSHCWDPFWDLSLPLTRGRHTCKLSDVVEDFIAKETLDSDERPVCSQCKKATRSTKQIELSRLPQLLILHLKKFTNDGYKMSSPEVRVDERLTFNNITYRLTACISHHGHSSSSGHYTSHSKYSSRWFHFNDDSPSKETGKRGVKKMVRSRVVPILVSNSLDLEQSIEVFDNDAKSVFNKFDCCSVFNGCNFLNSYFCSRKSIDCCTGQTSDIFCVAGAITAIVGALTAAISVFPKNQARIRVYLGCVGFAMVIVGLLIVFLSQKLTFHRRKLKLNKDSLDDGLINGKAQNFIKRRHSSAATWIIAASRPQRHQAIIDSSGITEKRKLSCQPMCELSVFQQQPPETPQTNNNQIQRRMKRGILLRSKSTFASQSEATSTNLSTTSFNEEMAAPALMLTQDQDQDLGESWNSPPIGVTTAALAIASVEHIHLQMRAMDELDSLDDEDVRQINNGEELLTSDHWTPNDAYGDDHQAAIEAALSTVLTVSTLVGFRAHQNHCCLRHAVQYKLRAKQWLKRLKRVSSGDWTLSDKTGSETKQQQAE